MPERPPQTLPEHVSDLARRVRKVETRHEPRQVSLFEAPGDLLVGLGPGVAEILPVGLDGYVPVADSTQDLGIRWDALTASLSPDVDCVVDHALVVSDPDAHIYKSFADAFTSEPLVNLRIYLRSLTPTISEGAVIPTACKHLYIRGRRESSGFVPVSAGMQMRSLSLTGGNSSTGSSLDLDGVAVDSYTIQTDGAGVYSGFVTALRLTFCVGYGAFGGSYFATAGAGCEFLYCTFNEGITAGATSCLVRMAGCQVTNGGGSWIAGVQGSIVENNRFDNSGITISSISASQNHISMTGNVSDSAMTLYARRCVNCTITNNTAKGVLSITAGSNAISLGSGAWQHPSAIIVTGNTGATGLVLDIGGNTSTDTWWNAVVVCCDNADGIGDIATNNQGGSSMNLSGGWGIVKGNRMRGNGGTVTPMIECDFSYELTFQGNQIESGPITPATDPGAATYLARIGATTALGNRELRCRTIIRDNTLRWYSQIPGGVFNANWFGIHLRAQVAVLLMRDNLIEAGTTHTDASSDATPDIGNNRLLAVVV